MLGDTLSYNVSTSRSNAYITNMSLKKTYMSYNPSFWHHFFSKITPDIHHSVYKFKRNLIYYHEININFKRLKKLVDDLGQSSVALVFRLLHLPFFFAALDTKCQWNQNHALTNREWEVEITGSWILLVTIFKKWFRKHKKWSLEQTKPWNQW